MTNSHQFVISFMNNEFVKVERKPVDSDHDVLTFGLDNVTNLFDLFYRPTKESYTRTKNLLESLWDDLREWRAEAKVRTVKFSDSVPLYSLEHYLQEFIAMTMNEDPYRQEAIKTTLKRIFTARGMHWIVSEPSNYAICFEVKILDIDHFPVVQCEHISDSRRVWFNFEHIEQHFPIFKQERKEGWVDAGS